MTLLTLVNFFEFILFADDATLITTIDSHDTEFEKIINKEFYSFSPAKKENIYSNNTNRRY